MGFNNKIFDWIYFISIFGYTYSCIMNNSLEWPLIGFIILGVWKIACQK